MSIVINNFVLRIMPLIAFSCYAYSQSVNQIPASAITDDPNLNPDWDWRLGDYPGSVYPYAQYRFYVRNSSGNIVDIPVDAPLVQGNAWLGLLDDRKEDGWVLLFKDFGTPTRSVSGIKSLKPAHFILYNKYRSVIRFFVNINEDQSFNKGFVELQFKEKDNVQKTPAVLAHLKPYADAIDGIAKMKNNSSSVFSDVVRKDMWLWADFPISYDPTITQKEDLSPPAFYFRVYGQMVSDINLEGVANGMQGNASAINKYLTGAAYGNAPLGIPGLSMPNISMGQPDINLSGGSYKTVSTQTDWNSFSHFFDNVRLSLPRVGLDNPFAGLINGFSSKLSSLKTILPIGLSGVDIGGVFDFFVGGGAKSMVAPEPAPTFISMNFSLSGKITSTLPIHELTITIPNTRSEFWKPTVGSSVGLIRNEPLGAFSLLTTPKIGAKRYTETIVDYFDFNGNPVYKDINFIEYEVLNELSLSINPSSDLVLIRTEAYLVSSYTYINNQSHLSLMEWLDAGRQHHLVEFDSPVNSNTILVRSMPVPIEFIKGRTIQLPYEGSGGLKLKLKLVFKRKDDPNSQPVVYISTYNVETGESFSAHSQPLPTLPPNGLNYTMPTTGAVKIFWDRNREKSVKSYQIERSINGGAFSMIGSTSDTVFIDREIEKSVKPYLSNRVNVSVTYRIRAYSEWLGDDNYIHSQFSKYSKNIALSGSMMSALGKLGHGQFTPESHSVSQNFPNPFNPSTTIYYGVKETGPVSIKVFNAVGQEIATLVNEQKEVGYHYVDWNASGLPSGIYFYRITAGDFVETKKMTLMK